LELEEYFDHLFKDSDEGNQEMLKLLKNATRMEAELKNQISES